MDHHDIKMHYQIDIIYYGYVLDLNTTAIHLSYRHRSAIAGVHTRPSSTTSIPLSHGHIMSYVVISI